VVVAGVHRVTLEGCLYRAALPPSSVEAVRESRRKDRSRDRELAGDRRGGRPRLGQEGAAVAVHGRDRKALESVARSLRGEGIRVVEAPGDLTRAADLERMRQRVEG